MSPGVRRVSAASARAHTRKPQPSAFTLSTGALKKVALVLLVGFVSWIYQAWIPPPPKICGSPGGPPVTAPRIRLSDGRHLAYKENGVPKIKAKYKIVFIHGFGSCRHEALPLPTEVAEELGVYLLSFDRSGYGESDPNPKRTEKSIALDVEELADQLGLGSTFYVIGFSMGGQAVWACLKYIPHRLVGAALLAPVSNYWWPGFPSDLSKEAYYLQFPQDQWAVRVAHYIPWMTYWWNTQKWFPGSSVVARRPDIFSRSDKEVIPKLLAARSKHQAQIKQQGDYESIHRDMIVGFGSWEFDPMDLDNPFPNNNGSVHLWQGDDDYLTPVILQRYIAKRLPWIRYHELSGIGHLFPIADGMAEARVRSLLSADQ